MGKITLLQCRIIMYRLRKTCWEYQRTRIELVQTFSKALIVDNRCPLRQTAVDRPNAEYPVFSNLARNRFESIISDYAVAGHLTSQNDAAWLHSSLISWNLNTIWFTCARISMDRLQALGGSLTGMGITKFISFVVMFPLGSAEFRSIWTRSCHQSFRISWMMMMLSPLKSTSIYVFFTPAVWTAAPPILWLTCISEIHIIQCYVS